MLQKTAPNRSDIGQRLWLAFGALFILIAVGVVVWTHWFVEKRRSHPLTSSSSPSSNIDTQQQQQPDSDSPVLNLLTMRKEDLIKMIPSYALVRLKSESGEGLPDAIKAILEGADQYVIMVGSRKTRGTERERLLSIYKLEGKELVDVSKDMIPDAYSGGRIGDESSKISFADNERDIEIAAPLLNNGIFQECAECEHAYSIQRLVWSEDGYALGEKSWRDDPYTVCYVAAHAMSKKTADKIDRPFLDESLDEEIAKGIDTSALWVVKRLSFSGNEGETPDSVSYLLSDGENEITVLVKKTEDKWSAVEIKR